LASARKSSTPAWRAIAGGKRVITSNHHRADAHGPQMIRLFGHCDMAAEHLYWWQRTTTARSVALTDVVKDAEN